MRHEGFESVAKLDLDDLKDLLRRGDPQERVWAAWALGLKLGPLILPELVACTFKSPAPGTRRHLIVVLAGLGETSVLKKLAEEDRDEYVRATACQYLIRTAPYPADEHTQKILLGKMSGGEPPIVREAIAQALVEHFRVLSPSNLERLIEQIRLEPDPTLRQYLVEICARAGCTDKLKELIQHMEETQREAILKLLSESNNGYGERGALAF